MSLQDYLLCFDSGDDLAIEQIYELIHAKTGVIDCIGTRDECFAVGVMKLNLLHGYASYHEIVINSGQLRHPMPDKKRAWNEIDYFLWKHGEPYR